MKLPNGYGSVTKLKDKPRRRPWMIRKNGRPVGYAKTKKEALDLLAEINKNDWSPQYNLTFEEVYELLVKHKFPRVSEGTRRHYKRCYKLSEPLHEMPYRNLRAFHFIELLDTKTDTINARRKMLQFFRAMDKVAFDFDVITKQYSQTIEHVREDHKPTRKPFSEEEIDLLWENVKLEDVDLVLILIYTGLRSGELADLKVKNIHLDDNYLIGGNKTKAGRDRIVPIHPRIKPLIEKRIERSKKETLLNYSAKQFRIKFKRVMEKLGLSHIPHECRHTMRTRLDNLDINANVINLIMGHAGSGIGERVYTHKTIEQLEQSVNRLK